MKASELRIGNLVRTNSSINCNKLKNVILSVKNIKQKYNKFIKENSYLVKCEYTNQGENKKRKKCVQFIEYIEPIKLTEEWMLKFGFIKCESKTEQGYQYGNYKAFSNSLGEINFCFLGFEDYYQHVKYVHQLQNLYFDLSGKELLFTLSGEELLFV